MKIDNARDFVTGLTAIIGLAGLAALLMLFGEMSNVAKRTYEIRLQVPTAAGLKGTSPVTMNGVKIGSIEDLSILPAARGVEISLAIQRGIQIPRAFTPNVESGFIGESTLELSVPQTLTPEQVADVLKEGETIQGKTLTTLIDRITKGVEQPLNRLTQTADGIDKLAATYTSVGERINEMLEPRTPGEVEAGKSPNIRSAVARLDAALTGANQWLSDAQLRQEAKDLLSRANKVTSDVSELTGAWSKAAGTVNDAIKNVGDRATEVAQQLGSSLGKIEQAAGGLATMIESINNGKGSAGQFVNNPDLYLSLRDAAQRLDKALVEVQLLVEKVKAEGIKIGI